MTRNCKKYIISGLVQGVGYRYFAYKAAEKYGIVGYAKNLYDGTVEIIAEGDVDKLQLFKSDLMQGPSRSRVEKIIEENCLLPADYHTFNVY